jgi:hypothetical protein
VFGRRIVAIIDAIPEYDGADIGMRDLDNELPRGESSTERYTYRGLRMSLDV